MKTATRQDFRKGQQIIDKHYGTEITLVKYTSLMAVSGGMVKPTKGWPTHWRGGGAYVSAAELYWIA